MASRKRKPGLTSLERYGAAGESREGFPGFCLPALGLMSPGLPPELGPPAGIQLEALPRTLLLVI